MMSPRSALSVEPAQPSGSVALHRFSHDAMACTWELFLVGVEPAYAGQVSWAAFDEVDRLERELSRFIPSSDVGRINALEPGETIRVGQAALECLQLASEIFRDTGGAFDITVGGFINARRDSNGRIQAPESSELAALPLFGMEQLVLDPDEYTVGRLTEDVVIDLGALGKGYALDRMADILRDWSVPAALIHCAQSTVLALGSPDGEQPWAVVLRDPNPDGQLLGEVYLFDRALSGSSRQILGHHIIDPRTGDSAQEKLATWAIAASAARSDALSTAFMVMAPEEVEAYCQEHPGVVGLLLMGDEAQPALLTYGQLADLGSE